MARKKWRCPHEGCDVESGRRWNLERHIKRAHQCECNPVKKSSDIIIKSPSKDRQFTRNEPGDRDAFPSKRSHFYLPSWNDYPFKVYHRNNDNNVSIEHNQKYGVVDSETDWVNVAYRIFKRLKKRNDKIFEMRDYINTYCSDFRFPFFSPLGREDYGAINSIFPSNFSHDLSSLVLGKSEFSPEPMLRSKKVIGYEVHNCGICLESESLPVICDPNEHYRVSKKEHKCDPHTVNTVKGYPRFGKEEICFHNVLSSLDLIIKTVKEWCRERIYLVCLRVSSTEIPMGTIDLIIKENQFTWLVRAIRQENTILDEGELKEFLTLTDYVSFCCLSISFVQAQQKSGKETFYFFLNYKPCVPFEN
jgi:hypothetical protein